nr:MULTISPECIES: hypothetical protein [Microbacterium]
MTRVDAAPAPAAPVPAPRRRRSLGLDLTVLGLVGVLLVAALGAGGAVVYRNLYSPAAFVERYLDLLGEGAAADALTVPGVQIDSLDLSSAGLPTTASDALLRRAALAPLTDVEVTSSEERDGVTHVTVEYSAGPHRGTSTFQVEQDGWVGVSPSWRFAQSPLAVINLTVRGAMQFSVNGFDIDKRQVSVDRLDADPLAPVPMLVFSPGLYSVSVQTPISASAGVAVLSDTPAADIPVNLQTEPTAEFIDVVQEKVEGFLDACTEQDVLQPTGCPFGWVVYNRIVDLPKWSMTTQPEISVVPDGADWAIERTKAVAHIEVDIQDIGTGAITHWDEDVPFFITGEIDVLPDGTASIQVSAAD